MAGKIQPWELKQLLMHSTEQIIYI